MKDIIVLLLTLLCTFFILNEAVMAEESTMASQIQDSDLDEELDEEDLDDEWLSGVRVSDPIEKVNRGLFKFNDVFYRGIMRPVSKGYKKVLPFRLRTSIRHFFQNINMPVRFVNNMIQGKPKRSFGELGRFVINSTVGLGGFLDPATKVWKMKAHPEDFGQTLGRWGVRPGFYLVLPILGPSNLRDFTGTFVDGFFSPRYYLLPHNGDIKFGVNALNNVNEGVFQLDKYLDLKKDALDPYTFFRDGYFQHRRQMVRE